MYESVRHTFSSLKLLRTTFARIVITSFSWIVQECLQSALVSPEGAGRDLEADICFSASKNAQAHGQSESYMKSHPSQ